MAAYYYLAASLPMLSSPDQEPPVSSESMLEICSRFMKEDEYLSVLASTINPDSDEASGICEYFHSWEKSLRNELVRLRAAAQGLDENKYLRVSEDIFGVGEIAAEAMAKQTPLEAELFLDYGRWNYIDELVTGHYFDIEFLRAYRLKLQLLERRASFEEDKGFAAYRELYARVLDASGAEVPVGGGKV